MPSKHSATPPRGPAARTIAPLAFLVLAAALLARPARTDDPVTLKTLELGRGPTLVLVHDLGMSRSIWMPVARRLISTHRVVMVDLPGHGESPMPSSFSLEAAAAALDRVVAREKAESTVVVGHGLGGVIALIAARQHPERARGLALVGIGLPMPAMPDQQRQRFLEFIDQRYDEFIKIFRGMGRDSIQGIAMHAQAARVPKSAMMPYLRELVLTAGTVWSKNVETPALVIAPVDSAVRDTTDLLATLGFDKLARVSLRRITGSGHYVMADQPDSLAARLREFSTEVIAKP